MSGPGQPTIFSIILIPVAWCFCYYLADEEV